MFDSENFNKIAVLVSKGGAMVVRKLLEKYSHPTSFSGYLRNNQAKILKTLTKTLYTAEQNLVFQTKIDQMDVSLLCKLAFTLFKPNMTPDEHKYIIEIKNKRNEFFHSDFLKTGKIKDSVFDATFKTVSDLLMLAAKEVGTAIFENEMNAFIERIKQSSPLFSEVYEELRKACASSNDDMIEKLHKTLTDVMPEILVEKSSKRPLTCMKDKFIRNFERFNTAAEVSETRMMSQALKCLEDTNVVTLTGRVGEGKSTTAFHLAKILSSKDAIKLDRCVMLLDPNELKHFTSNEVDLILIDDIFGKHSATNLAEWEKYFETLISFVQSSRKIKLISCSRKHIIRELSDKLAGNPLFRKQVEIDSAELTKDEKLNILKAKLLEHNRDMDEKEIEKCIKQKESNAGFPSIAAKFAADDSLFASRFKYFAEPVSYYLEQNIRNIDIYSWAALVFLKQNGNQLTLDKPRSTDECLARLAIRIGIKEEPVTLAQNIWKRYKYLDGTFVRICEDSIIFLFDTVSNAIAEIFQDDHDMGSPVEEANEATESNVQNMVMSNTQAGRQKPQNKERNETHAGRQEPNPRENPIVRFFKRLWRKISSLWNKKKEKGNDRGPHDVETGTK